MCFALPCQIKKITGKKAVTKTHKKINLEILGQDVKPGDWVLAQADLAVEKISEKKAKNIINQLENL